MIRTAGIAGAGIAGRMLALELHERGWTVTLFDRDTPEGRDSCTWVGAGMLAPRCELESAEPEIARLGCDGIARWPAWLARLGTPVYHQQDGSLVVAHPRDLPELDRFHRMIEEKTGEPVTRIGPDRIAELEPELAGRFNSGLFFEEEGHLDNRGLLRALRTALEQKTIAWRNGIHVERVEPGKLHTSAGIEQFDLAVDCRGLGARSQQPELRGVRGELLYVHAPDVQLHRPVRLMHPRYPLYVAPRPNHLYVVGATRIESDDRGPVTARSVLELLSAAYALHPSFAEARLMETATQCRPAFADNRPRIELRPGCLSINGLYRHGFLLAPALIAAAISVLECEPLHPTAAPFVEHTGCN